MRETKILSIGSLAACEDKLDEAARILRSGGLVAIPTETVYGLAANAEDPVAVASIFAAKGRPQDNPLIVHIAALSAWPRVVSAVSPAAMALAERFWPGPLTIILPKNPNIPAITCAGLSTVAVRFPSHPVAQEIIRRSGVPVAAPSANLSGSPSTTTAAHCMRDLTGRVDAIVDGGPCTVGVESTVITLAGPVPRLLRPGYITLEQLQSVLGTVEVDKAVTDQPELGAQVASPGMKYKHYAPRCRVVLVDGTREQYTAYANAHHTPGEFALCYEEDIPYLHCPALSLGCEKDEATQAARLFEALRQLDDRGAQVVYARCPKKQGVGLALYNRLVRAAAFAVVQL